MKDLLNILTEGWREENLTAGEKIQFGIIVPALLIAACLFAELLNR